MTSCGHTRHRAGCPSCQWRARHYTRRRTRQMANGTWQHTRPVDEVRRHIETLRASGMTDASIRRQANVPKHTLYGIVNNQSRQWVHGATATAILAVQPASVPTPRLGHVPAVGTVRLLRGLVAVGHPVLHIGQRLPVNTDHLYRIVRRGAAAVTAELADAVRALVAELIDAPSPADRLAVLARNHAARYGWAPLGAWDDVDDPDAKPNLGANDDPAVDDVLVRYVLHGRRPIADLNTAEQVELWRVFTRHRREAGHTGVGLADFGARFGLGKGRATRIRDAAERNHVQPHDQRQQAA